MSAAEGGSGGIGILTPSQKHWARKHKQLNKYAHQHNKDPEWFKHEKHILICSWAGRPVYTRFGDESKLAAYLGVISAVISNFQRMGDNVRSIVAGNHTFLFEIIGPIYLVAISRTCESVPQLRTQLNLAHSQILSVLTGSVARVLEDRPQYDIRNLMGGTENLLSDLIQEFDRNPCFILDSVQCLRMPRSARSRIGSALRKGKTKSLLYCILMAGNRIVNLIRGKDRVLHTADLQLLINTVTNSQSLRSSESWTPICLPKFSDKGYLYAYVCYIAEDVSLSLVTGDSLDFHNMQAAKVTMLDALTKKGCLNDIAAAIKVLSSWCCTDIRSVDPHPHNPARFHTRICSDWFAWIFHMLVCSGSLLVVAHAVFSPTCTSDRVRIAMSSWRRFKWESRNCDISCTRPSPSRSSSFPISVHHSRPNERKNSFSAGLFRHAARTPLPPYARVS